MTEDPNAVLIRNLRRVAADSNTYERTLINFITTFNRLRLVRQSDDLAQFVLATILKSETIESAEQKIRDRFECTRGSSDRSVFDLIKHGLAGRFEIMYRQLLPYFSGVSRAIDYGCGAGVLTQMLHDRIGLEIEGVDVRDFRAGGVSVPIRQFDGYRIPVEDGHYQCAVLTNVIHHEAENERLLQELDRIAVHRLVIIETVPEAETEEEAQADWGRMLLNDALWNRFFNYANIPCPGTYETPKGWEQRFSWYGWQVAHSEDLGFDQPTIQDRHHLLVFER